MPSEEGKWPDLPLAAWSETCDTLHLWTQIVGKVRIALTPLINHWWNATFLVTARGLAAPAMPYAGRTLDIIFDFVNHQLVIETSDGGVENIPLKTKAVADFYNEFMQRLQRLGIDIRIWTMPSEIENAIPFERDSTHAQYDPVYAQKFWLALLQANRVMNEFRARFIGKASPVHFFWGSFDLAVTRFSGRTAPPPKGTTPHVASWVISESYSHEVSSCGFWPGNMSTLIQSPPATPTRASPRPTHFTTRGSGNSSCLTTQGVSRVTRTGSCSVFFRKLMKLSRSWRDGTARRWSASLRAAR